uniref:NADH dehydrogenase subunit 4 n=1 Tax=Plaxiphora tricolor TaxID=2045497 RepID=UPI002E76E5B1|nr:NADH dehydrogenase subunit 4 [Plaxiphora tricolor]WRI60249.1 NADH dehydrogenase subunit 4 [Plaxiphora tricolor]
MLAFFILSLMMGLMIFKLKYGWYIMNWVFLVLFFLFSLNFFSSMGVSKVLFNFFLDEYSISLIMLSCWICSLMIISSYKIMNMNEKYKEFLIVVVGLNFLIVSMFFQKSLIMLYVFFEGSLIPTLVLILIWGYQPERLQAGMYLVIYTIIGALPFLINVFFLYKLNGHLNILFSLSCFSLCFPLNMIWWSFMLLVFLVKLPIYGVHLWLPKAHVEAPVAGSMILAGLLLKLGGYGLIRLSFMFFKVNIFMNFFFLSLGLIGGMLSSIICIRQRDIKSLIAYSSIGHMGMMLSGVLSGSEWGMKMGIFMMICHGLCSSGLFCMANMSYEKTGSRNLSMSKGFLGSAPSFSMWFFLLCSVNMAAPPSLNLLSEVGLIINSLFVSFYFWFFLGIMSMMSAVYSLFLYTSTQHGKISSFCLCYNSMKMMNYFILFFHWIPIQILILLVDLF